jgi:hypothetical protein
MSQQLLLTACEQAERSETAVRAAALMHIARVLARSDEPAAVALLKRGLTLAKSLDGETAELLLNNAVFLAAAVSPRDAFQLYADQKPNARKGSAVMEARLLDWRTQWPSTATSESSSRISTIRPQENVSLYILWATSPANARTMRLA